MPAIPFDTQGPNPTTTDHQGTAPPAFLPPPSSQADRTAQTRAVIFDALLNLIRREGIARFSMDSLAKEAGLSKGGLFHHFPTKEALLKALIDSVAERVLQVVEVQIARDNQPGALLRGITTAIFSGVPPYPEGLTPEELATLQLTTEEALCSLLSSVISNREVTTSMRAALRTMAERMLQEPLGERQFQIWLAAEGLMFWGMVGVYERKDPMFPEAVAAIRKSVNAVCAELQREGFRRDL